MNYVAAALLFALTVTVLWSLLAPHYRIRRRMTPEQRADEDAAIQQPWNEKTQERLSRVRRRIKNTVQQ